jgi:NTP pyrophosphatase (non-canonical NTP hydrolase)
MALAGEAGELLELFQWLTADESQTVMADPQKAMAVRHELADILFYALRLADKLDIRIEEALREKMEQNARRYPVALAKGHARKYTELEREGK